MCDSKMDKVYWNSRNLTSMIIIIIIVDLLMSDVGNYEVY